jgi:mono/diheme cytochrome c family protein
MATCRRASFSIFKEQQHDPIHQFYRRRGARPRPVGRCAGGIAAPGQVSSAMGHGLAQRICTSCHLIESGQSNPPDHVGGPALPTVADRPGTTERLLRDHLRTTHANGRIPLAMPNPALTDDETTKIVDYILSLHQPRRQPSAEPAAIPSAAVANASVHDRDG